MANNADVHIHILATSASNISTDALAVRLYKIIKEIGHQGQYCVRAHSGLKPPGGMIVDGTPTGNTTDLIDEIGIMTVWKNVTIAEKEAEREEGDYLFHTSKFAGLFHRVIADEGHKLKNCRTLKATAVDKLYCPKNLEELDGYTLPTNPFGIYDPETVNDWGENAPEYVDNARFWVTGTASNAGRYVAQAQDTIGKRKRGVQRGDAGGKFEKTRDIEYEKPMMMAKPAPAVDEPMPDAPIEDGNEPIVPREHCHQDDNHHIDLNRTSFQACGTSPSVQVFRRMISSRKYSVFLTF
ncbi:hypothetical protein LTR72_001661 [Exophiala xenobiotica]|nr:hypothetical protein LTR72_001661 [Exophiala xenobiotica]KAK5296092.1 hypothetical protein LTR14_003723 [Exophiala xenobiotica]KAK5492506.1 hypothetical protein LTR55_003861 [Exophiala xenobiotica]